MHYSRVLLHAGSALGVVCIAAFVLYTSFYATGIPQSDDYPMMIGFLDRWDAARGFGPKCDLLMEQFLEHRMVAMKLTALAVRNVYGSMDMNLMCLAGMLIWLGTFFMLMRAAVRAGLPLVNFVPIVFLLFHPGYTFDGLFWAATWMAFPWAIFLCASAFYCLIFNRSRFGFALASLLACLALFSHGNGICAFIVGFVILGIQRNWKFAMLWIVVAVLGVSFFFTNYQWASSSVSSPLQNVWHNGRYVWASLGAFIGSAVYFPAINVDERTLTVSNMHAVVFGLALCAFFLGYFIFLVKQFEDTEKNRFRLLCWSLGALTILTGILMSMMRVKTEMILGFIGRYHFYSLLAICSGYLMLCTHARFAPNRRFAFTLAAMLVCAANYWVQTVDVADHARQFQAGLYNSGFTGRWIIYGGVPYFETGINEYANAVLWPGRSGNYRYPAIALSTHSAQNKMMNAGNYVHIRDSEHHILIEVSGKAFTIPNFGRNTNGTYLYLKSNAGSFFYPLRQKRSSVRAFIMSGKYFKSEAVLLIRKNWFPKGIYNLFLYHPGSNAIINLQRRTTIS